MAPRIRRPARNLGLIGTIPPHQWFWDGFEHVDPAKEANAQETRLKNLSTTLAHEYAKQGLDWESELRQRAKEKAFIRELGLSEVETVPAADDGDPEKGDDDDGNDTEEDTDE